MEEIEVINGSYGISYMTKPDGVVINIEYTSDFYQAVDQINAYVDMLKNKEKIKELEKKKTKDSR